jgi:hypothetical protein
MRLIQFLAENGTQHVGCVADDGRSVRAVGGFVSSYELALAAIARRVSVDALAQPALEWTLIALLLINGLLSHAVARFAAYFGLSPPCLLCTRVDRLYGAAHEDDDEAAGDARWLRGVLCGAHAAEISGMGTASATAGLSPRPPTCARGACLLGTRKRVETVQGRPRCAPAAKLL